MTLSRPILALLTTSLLFAAAGGRGQPVTMPSLVTLDDFESYASSNALAAVWSNFAGAGVIGLETNIVCGGTQALRLKYSLAASPNTNTVARTFSSPQDWSTFNTITFNPRPSRRRPGKLYAYRGHHLLALHQRNTGSLEADFVYQHEPSN
jgi:hypothetical protein